MQIEGEWCILGNFNMVERKKDSLDMSSVNLGSKKWALMDVWEGELRDEDLGFTYTSLQFLVIVSRLDRCYCLHHADWVPHSVSVFVDRTQALSDHFPLTFTLRSSRLEHLIPSGDKKLLVTGSHLFKNLGFRALSKSSIDRLLKNLHQCKATPWQWFVKDIQVAIKAALEYVFLALSQKPQYRSNDISLVLLSRPSSTLYSRSMAASSSPFL